jgi:hypothetical protein
MSALERILDDEFASSMARNRLEDIKKACRGMSKAEKRYFGMMLLSQLLSTKQADRPPYLSQTSVADLFLDLMS